MSGLDWRRPRYDVVSILRIVETSRTESCSLYCSSPCRCTTIFRNVGYYRPTTQHRIPEYPSIHILEFCSSATRRQRRATALYSFSPEGPEHVAAVVLWCYCDFNNCVHSVVVQVSVIHVSTVCILVSVTWRLGSVVFTLSIIRVLEL